MVFCILLRPRCLTSRQPYHEYRREILALFLYSCIQQVQTAKESTYTSIHLSITQIASIHPQHTSTAFSRLHTSKENSPTTSNHQTSATMPDHQQPSSSAQAPSGSSNTPASEVEIERFGKVSGDHQQFAGALPAYITIVPDDNEGPLNDQDGNLTSTDLVVGGHMLVTATEENRRQALARGENVDDSTDLMRVFLKMGDRVSLIYSSGSRLIAVKQLKECRGCG